MRVLRACCGAECVYARQYVFVGHLHGDLGRNTATAALRHSGSNTKTPVAHATAHHMSERARVRDSTHIDVGASLVRDNTDWVHDATHTNNRLRAPAE